MPGIFSRLTGGSKLTLAEKHQMLIDAMEMHRAGAHPPDVEAALRARGAATREARDLSTEALAKFEAELLRDVSLPTSAHLDVNYYFLLGVTPRATPDQIRRAYHRKAKEVHPDQHNEEFSREAWSRLMELVGEANHVLSDPQARRAYDIIWRERSREVAEKNRAQGEHRGDWETRYRWEIAELGEMEDSISLLLQEIAAPPEGRTATLLGHAIDRAIEDYESELLEIRSQTHVLPKTFAQFGERVRGEMHRKERLVAGLRQVRTALMEDGAVIPADTLAEVERVLEEVRRHQHHFDLAAARIVA